MSYSQRSDLDSYLDEAARYPLLSREKEMELARRSLLGDKTARDELVCSNLRLVVSIAKSFRTNKMTLADLVGEGNVGLIRAAQTYDGERFPDVRFSTYAGRLIRNEILSALKEDNGLFGIPSGVYSYRKAYWAAADTFLGENGREATDEEIMTLSGLSQTQLESVRASMCVAVSIDAEAYPGEDGTSIAETIADPRADVEQEAVTAAMYSEVCDLMEVILSVRERIVLSMRYGLGNLHGKTSSHDKIGRTLGMGRESVRQMELTALSKLRTAYESGDHRNGLRQILLWAEMIEEAA